MDLFTTQDEDQIPDNALEMLVGEGKKFKDNELLAKSKFESDNFVKKLQAENAMLRTELGSAKKLEELFSKVNQSQVNNDTNQSRENQQPETPDISAIVNAELEKRLASQRLADNLNTVNNELSNRFGDSANAEITKRAIELGVSKEYLRDLASKAPKVLLNLFPVITSKTPDVFSAGPRTRLTEGQTQVTARNQQYYDDLRKKDRKQWDNTAMQRMNDALALGEAYFTKAS